MLYHLSDLPKVNVKGNADMQKVVTTRKDIGWNTVEIVETVRLNYMNDHFFA